MKVYILMSMTGETNEFHGAFSTPELAEEWITKWPEYRKQAYYITEQELDFPNDNLTIKDFQYDKTAE
jgi:hypothetical protein